VDQQFAGPFGIDVGINATGGVAEGFTPSQTSLVAVDVFITSGGTNPALTLTANIRKGSFDGPVLVSSTFVVPANTSATFASPDIIHVDFGGILTLIPGNLYFIQINPDGGFLGVAAADGNPYAGGDGYQGNFTCCGLDLGFRTYYSTSPFVPLAPSQCVEKVYDRVVSMNSPIYNSFEAKRFLLFAPANGNTIVNLLLAHDSCVVAGRNSLTATVNFGSNVLIGSPDRDSLNGGNGPDLIIGNGAPKGQKDTEIGGQGIDTCLGDPSQTVKLQCEILSQAP
jgi:hypothetical protein